MLASWFLAVIQTPVITRQEVVRKTKHCYHFMGKNNSLVSIAFAKKSKLTFLKHSLKRFLRNIDIGPHTPCVLSHVTAILRVIAWNQMGRVGPSISMIILA